MSNAEIRELLDSRGIGGIETHVAILAATLHDAGRDAHVVLLRDYGGHSLAETLSRQGVPLNILAGGWRALWAALRERRPGLLHTHGYKAGVLGRMAGRLQGIPVVSSHHAGEPGQADGGLIAGGGLVQPEITGDASADGIEAPGIRLGAAAVVRATTSGSVWSPLVVPLIRMASPRAVPSAL